MHRESFIFYRSFLEACEMLPEEERGKYIYIVTKYGLDGVVAEELLEDNAVLKALFVLVKPQIDANNKKYAAGLKGGRPKNGKKKKTNGYETKKPMVLKVDNQWFENEKTNGYETKKPNVNENENENVNDNVNENDNANGVSAGKHINELFSEIGIRENPMRFVSG